MTNDEKMAKEFIDKTWPRKGPCLVPIIGAVNESSLLLTSHENDYCQCDVKEAYLAGTKAELDRVSRFISELRKALPHAPMMDGEASFNHAQKLVARAIREYEKGE